MATFSREEVLKFHQGGKVAVHLPKPLKTKEDLCLAYTPGVALAVKEIAARPAAAFDCTAKSNLVAVVSDGRRWCRTARPSSDSATSAPPRPYQ